MASRRGNIESSERRKRSGGCVVVMGGGQHKGRRRQKTLSRRSMLWKSGKNTQKGKKKSVTEWKGFFFLDWFQFLTHTLISHKNGSRTFPEIHQEAKTFKGVRLKRSEVSGEREDGVREFSVGIILTGAASSCRRSGVSQSRTWNRRLSTCRSTSCEVTATEFTHRRGVGGRGGGGGGLLWSSARLSGSSLPSSSSSSSLPALLNILFIRSPAAAVAAAHCVSSPAR